MERSEAQKRADRAYIAKLKRIPLNVRLEEYEEIASAARDAGESVNSYIRGAVRMRMAGGMSAPPEPERVPFEDAP